MTKSQLLTEAANLLERDGWCQEAYHDWQSRRCILGALYHAEFGSADPRFIDMRSASAVAAVKLTNAVGMHIAAWNDQPNRTKEEVIALLLAVAATEKAMEAHLPMEAPPITEPEFPVTVEDGDLEIEEEEEEEDEEEACLKPARIRELVPA